MDRLAKFFDKSVTGVTDKVRTITSDFSRRSKRRKQERKEKKQKKLQNKNQNQLDSSDIEHKYKLVCDLPNCEYHPKPNAYEDFLNTLWTPRSNRSNSSYGSQIITTDDKSSSSPSIADKENLIIDDKLEKVKDRLNSLNDNLSDKCSYSSTDKSKESLSDSSSTDNDFEAILNEKNKDIKLTITNENGETTTVIDDKSRIHGFQRNAHLIKV